MPHRFMRAVESLVAHGLREMSVEGASLEHVLREVALMGALVGSGVDPTEAIRQVESIEPQLLRTHPGERIEPYYPGHYGTGTTGAADTAGITGIPGIGTMGLPEPFGTGKAPFGKGVDMGGFPTIYGKGIGMGGISPYGKGKAGLTPYGKGAITPYSKGMGGVTPFGKGMGTSPFTSPWG